MTIPSHGRRWLSRWAWTAATASTCFLATAILASASAEVLIFAAASTTNAIEDIARAYSARDFGAVRAAFAGSSTLARQIAAGAPADIYLSASPQWMEFLAARNDLEPGTQRNLLGNRLVLVVPKATPITVRLQPGFPLVQALNGKPLAIGDPEHVPAGMYARAALMTLGLWETVAAHTAPMHHVRAALALVERGEAAAGVVYSTDAAVSSRVSVAATFPPGSHAPILYPVAIVAGRDRPEVRRFFAFLTSTDAMVIFSSHGFTDASPTER